MNAEMTHCAIYGAVSPLNIDNTAMAAAEMIQTYENNNA